MSRAIYGSLSLKNQSFLELFDSTNTRSIQLVPPSSVGTSSVLTLPVVAADTLVARTTTDTLTNKTLSGNTATNLVNGSGTFNLNSSGTLTAPNATDTLVGRTTADTLTNKVLSAATATNSWTPSTDNAVDDGSAALRWANVHSLNFKSYGSTSGVLTQKAAATTTSYTLTWPSAQGGAGTFLKNDGSGGLTWQAESIVSSSKTTWSSVTHTVTISNASPGVVTDTAHGLVNNQALYLTTTGTLPAPLQPNTIYYVTAATTNTYELSATYGGSAINTTSAGSGTHTANITSININHNLGSTDTLVQTFDLTNSQNFEVDQVVHVDGNNTLLNATSLPGGSGWRVLILSI